MMMHISNLGVGILITFCESVHEFCNFNHFKDE